MATHSTNVKVLAVSAVYFCASAKMCQSSVLNCLPVALLEGFRPHAPRFPQNAVAVKRLASNTFARVQTSMRQPTAKLHVGAREHIASGSTGLNTGSAGMANR